MPTYIMSLFSVPVHVVKRIEALRRNFFGKVTVAKKNLFGQMEYSLPVRRKGQLELRIWEFRIGLWRFVADDESLWKDVIRYKCGIKGKWTIKSVNGPSRLSWKSLRNL